MNKHSKLEKDYLKKGYIIKNVENKKSLSYIKNFVKKQVEKALKLSKKEIKNFSFDKMHNFTDKKNLNNLRLKLINLINNDKKFRKNFFLLAKNTLSSIVGNELAMQNKINLSIQYPHDEDSLLPLHSDTWSGDSPFESVVWLPLVNCFKTKSMFILNSKKDIKFRKIYSKKKIKSSSDLHAILKKDLSFIKINYGNFLLFNQNLPHGNVINITNETRISFNCRFKGLFTPYAQKELGSFFSPITIRPASEIGIKYKFPGE